MWVMGRPKAHERLSPRLRPPQRAVTGAPCRNAPVHGRVTSITSAAQLRRCDVPKKTASRKKTAAKKAAQTSGKKSAVRKGKVAKAATKPVKKATTRKSSALRRPKGPAWQWSAV